MAAQPAPTLGVIRVLVVSLLTGMLMFVAVSLFLKSNQSAMPGGAAVPAPTAPGGIGVPVGSSPVDLMMMALAGMGVFATAGFLFAPALTIKPIAAKWRAAPDEASREFALMSGLMTMTILRAAVVEGFGLFGAVIFFLHQEYTALIAPALAACALVTLVPTRTTRENFQQRLERSV
jgi:hypothetical protein